MASPRIDPTVVRHVAKLAALSLEPGEAERLASELARIVAYVEQLAELDTRGVPPTAHVQIERMPLRDDEPVPGLGHDEALAGAPRVEEGGFAVPVFVE